MAAVAALKSSAVIAAPISPAVTSGRAAKRIGLLLSARPACFPRRGGARIQSSSAQEAISDIISEAAVVEDSIAPAKVDGIGSSGLTIGQTKQLIDFMCNETQFVEVELELGDKYSVRIKRASPTSSSLQAASLSASGEVDASAAALDGSAKIMPAAPPAAETVAALSMEPKKGERTPLKASELFHGTLIFGHASSKTSSASCNHSIVVLIESSADKPFYGSDASAESLSFTIKSNKVGILRLGPIVKGAAGKPLISVGDIVRTGQKVAFVEQLGTLEPITAQDRGEVVNVLLEDGAPLEFGQPIFEVAPVFVGIKRGAE